jgi:hypothetical protein
MAVSGMLVAEAIRVVETHRARRTAAMLGKIERNGLYMANLLLVMGQEWQRPVRQQADLRGQEKSFAKPLILGYLPIHEARTGQEITCCCANWRSKSSFSQ